MEANETKPEIRLCSLLPLSGTFSVLQESKMLMTMDKNEVTSAPPPPMQVGGWWPVVVYVLREKS